MWASNPASLDRGGLPPAPAGQRDEHQVLPPWRLADAAADFVAVHSRQADVEQDGVGANPLGGFEGLEAVVRFAFRGLPAAAASPAIPRRRRCRRRSGCDGATAGAGGRRVGAADWPRRAVGQNGQTNDELAAAAESVAAVPRPFRHASRPASSPASGRCRARPANAPATYPPARTCRRCPAGVSAAMPMPLSRTRITACVAFLLDGQPTCPPCR